MTAACTAPLPPAAGWGAAAGRERLLRASLVLATAAALHLGAAAVFIRGTGGVPGAPGSAVASVTLLWLVPQQGSAPTQAQTVPPHAASKTALPVTPRAQRTRPAHPPPEDSTDATRPAPTLRADETAPPPASPAEPSYAITRRSLAFAGASTSHDAPTTSASAARPLAAWLQEGVARSVWPVANGLAAAGAGACRATLQAPQLACDEALADALDRIPADQRRSLATWLESRLVSEIVITVEDGAARYTVR
jgi:hypothetical protein